jgi:hypothetical protein
MRRSVSLLGVLGLVGVGVFACDQSPQIQTVPLGFTIVEGLLNTSQTDPTLASVILTSTAGNCPSYQLGLNVTNIAQTAALVFHLEVHDGDGGFLPVTGGQYTVETNFTTAAGNFSYVTETETSLICGSTPTGSNSGTVTLDPFHPDAGETSDVSYSIVFGYNQFVGAFPLTTCLIPPTATVPDAGACYLPAGGGPI